MTKRRPLSDLTEHEFMWVPRDGVGKQSAIVRGSGAKTEQEIYAALLEQLYEARGGDAVAGLLAGLLRFPAPHPDVIATVARWLDPQTDDYIKLVVVGRRGGKRLTKRVNGAAIAKAVKKNMELRGNKHGDQKKAVCEVAKLFGVSKPTVLKAIRSK
jgi:hypothetical protein